jgi:hypothetical protein
VLTVEEAQKLIESAHRAKIIMNQMCSVSLFCNLKKSEVINIIEARHTIEMFKWDNSTDKCPTYHLISLFLVCIKSFVN